MSNACDKLKQIRLTEENRCQLEKFVAESIPKTTIVNAANAAITVGLPMIVRMTKQPKPKGK